MSYDYFVVFRKNEKISVYFLLQHRVGHGQGNKLSSLLVGTFDSLFETKPSPYRILHQTSKSEVYYGIIVFDSYFIITVIYNKLVKIR